MPFDNSRLPETHVGKIRDFFGPNGERWCRWTTLDWHGRRCLFGVMINTIDGYEALPYLLSAITKMGSSEEFIERNNRQAEKDGVLRRKIPISHLIYGHDVVTYNNAARDFSDIAKLLDVAEEIELAKKMEVASV